MTRRLIPLLLAALAWLATLPALAMEPGVAEAVQRLQGRWAEIRYTLPADRQADAYTSLGALYYQVPGWPLSFGDDDRAEHYLRRGLAVNPEGLDSLYFWGDYLHEQGRDEEARKALRQALAAAPRPGRERADAGRREEIRRLLAERDD